MASSNPNPPTSGPPPTIDSISSEIEERDNVTSPTPSLPPSYEQALQHRCIEYNPYQGPYEGPPCIWGQDDLESARGCRGYQSHGRLQRPVRLDCDTDSMDESTEGCIKMTLPPMHMCMAVTCLVLNFLIPGFGTMLAALGVFCCVRPSSAWTVRRQLGACGLNIAIGLAQLLLTPVLLLGWVWSILWGFAFVGVSHAEYHSAKRERETSRSQQPRREEITTTTTTTTREITQTSSSCTQHEVRPVIHAPPRDHQRELTIQSESSVCPGPDGGISCANSRPSISSAQMNSRRGSVTQTLGLRGRSSVEPMDGITNVSG